MREPWDIKAGERYAWKARGGQWVISVSAREYSDPDDCHRVLSADEIKSLPEGATVVRIGDGMKGTVGDYGCIRWDDGVPTYLAAAANLGYALALLSLPPTERVRRLHNDWMGDPQYAEAYVKVRDELDGIGRGEGFALGYEAGQLSYLKTYDSVDEILDDTEPDGSWDNPWPEGTSCQRDGWHMADPYRQHYSGGSMLNPDGPYEVTISGTRLFDNGTILKPSVFTNDLPGGSSKAPWANGFRES